MEHLIGVDVAPGRLALQVAAILRNLAEVLSSLFIRHSGVRNGVDDRLPRCVRVLGPVRDIWVRRSDLGESVNRVAMVDRE
ncbi:hypothetical protein GS921_25305 [Rhodococcus hoagii]|nr:hypothetical protein [Prescottella equi]